MTRPVVLVSGATSGIGRATALAFARQGARLMLGGRDAARGEAVVAACRAEGAEASFLAGDLAEAGTAAALVDAAIACWGRLDIAFNNAGWQEPQGSLVDRDLAVLDRVFAINLRSVAEAMQAQIRVMRQRDGGRAGGGVIVNDASVSGVRNPYPGFAIYAASKAALLSLTRSLAIEHAPRGIRINAVSPGRIETPMMAGAGVADFATIATTLPARRMGRPEDVAAAVLWLASGAAGFVIGQNLCVDGGFLAG